MSVFPRTGTGLFDARFVRDARGRLLFLPLHHLGRQGCVVPDADTEQRLRRSARHASRVELVVVGVLAAVAVLAGLHWAWLLLLAPVFLGARLLADRQLARGLERVEVPLPGSWSLEEQALRRSPAQLRGLVLAALVGGIVSLWALHNGPQPGLGVLGLVLSAFALLLFLAMLGRRTRSR